MGKKIEEILAKLKEIEGDDSEFSDSLSEIISAKNKDAEKQRKGKGALKTQIKELVELIGVEKAEELAGESTGSPNEIAMLKKEIGKLKSHNQETEEHAKKTALDSKITKILVDKGIKENFDFIKKGLLAQVEQGETGLLIGESSVEDYIQAEFIDSDESITHKKDKKDKKPGSTTDLFTKEELESTPGLYQEHPEKVKQSLDAL